MKKLFFLLVISTNIAITQGQSVIYTPTGSSVSYDYEEEMSQEQIEDSDEYWQSRIDQNGWKAVIIGSSSDQYNCHSYAWHVSDGGNLVWINSPANYYSGESPTYVSTTNTEDSLRKIVYDYEYGGGHSAISTNTENYVVSKWGGGPLVRHAIYDWPWIGESAPEGADFYEIDIDGDDDVDVGGTANETTLNISGATYNWSGDNYYICGSGNSYIGTITGLIKTPNGIYSPIKVEITSPYSNTTVKGDRKNFITVNDFNLDITISAAGGSRLVCSSGLSFTVNNLPTGWTIEWICGSSLSRVSVQGSNPCTFSSTGNGSSWVNAIVHPSTCGGIQLSQYDVWSGKPLLNVSGPSEGYVYNTYTFYANPGTYSSPTDFDYWYLNPLLDNHVYDYDSYADIAFYDAYEGYQVVCRAKNTCNSGAWGDWSLTNISIYEDEKFLMSPNPASEFVTISLKKSSEPELKKEKSDAIYTIKILDVYGNLKHSAIRSGDSFTLPVNNLVDGNYFLQIINGKKVSNLKLIVKH